MSLELKITRMIGGVVILCGVFWLGMHAGISDKEGLALDMRPVLTKAIADKCSARVMARSIDLGPYAPAVSLYAACLLLYRHQANVLASSISWEQNGELVHELDTLDYPIDLHVGS
jgi:uncharacterized membrane protein YqgA involved in biofilm formation